MRKWRIEDSEELYNIKGWGVSYFGINDKGHAYVSPRKNSVRVDLKEVVDELALRASPPRCCSAFPTYLTTALRKRLTALHGQKRNTTSKPTISSFFL